MVMCYLSFGKDTDSGCLTSIDDFTYFDLVTLGKEKFPYLRCVVVLRMQELHAIA